MKTSCATQCFEKLFSSYLDSWILSLESWNLILESWNQISLDSWSVLDSILISFSWAFCHHLCYHQNSLNQSWFIIMKLASTGKTFTRTLLHESPHLCCNAPTTTRCFACHTLILDQSRRYILSLCAFCLPLILEIFLFDF